MFSRKQICSEDMAHFLYGLSFLGPWIYGYATVSYNQNLDHLQFWPALTAIKTALLKVKFVLGKTTMNLLLSEANTNYRYHRRLIVTHIRKLKRIHKLGQYTGYTNLYVYI